MIGRVVTGDSPVVFVVFFLLRIGLVYCREILSVLMLLIYWVQG